MLLKNYILLTLILFFILKKEKTQTKLETDTILIIV
jgi:hypothetical protein